MLQDDFAGRRKGEVVFLIAWSAEPVMFEDLCFVFAGDDPDDTAIAEVVEFSSCSRD